MAKGIEIHNGHVVFSYAPKFETRGNPFDLAKDEECWDLDVSPKSGVTEMGTAKALRVRVNVTEEDLTSGDLRVLDIEGRAAKDVPTMRGINMDMMARDDVDMTELNGAMIKMETTSGAGTVAKAVALSLDAAFATAPTLSSMIRFQGQYEAHDVDYILDAHGGIDCIPGTAYARFPDDGTIFADAGDKTGSAAGWITVVVGSATRYIQLYS